MSQRRTSGGSGEMERMTFTLQPATARKLEELRRLWYGERGGTASVTVDRCIEDVWMREIGHSEPDEAPQE